MSQLEVFLTKQIADRRKNEGKINLEKEEIILLPYLFAGKEIENFYHVDGNRILCKWRYYSGWCPGYYKVYLNIYCQTGSDSRIKLIDSLAFLIEVAEITK